MNELGNAEKQEIGRLFLSRRFSRVGRWANNRVENSHLPFRRRERAKLRFRRMKTLQKFASVHANVHNHINQERHLVDRQTYKDRRSAALAEWQAVMSWARALSHSSIVSKRVAIKLTAPSLVLGSTSRWMPSLGRRITMV